MNDEQQEIYDDGYKEFMNDVSENMCPYSGLDAEFWYGGCRNGSFRKSNIMHQDKIDQFQGKYDFLSNFYPAVISWCGITYPTTENAYQASKTTDHTTRIQLSLMTPGKCKRAKPPNPMDWQEEYAGPLVMYEVNTLKYQIPELREMLLATGDVELIEGNHWNDTYWGVDLKTGKGQNRLGKILMRIRAEIRGETVDTFF